MKPANKFHYYAYTFCRYFAATMIMIYAFAKIIGTQFTTPLLTYDTPVGSLSGMQLTWFYYGFSYPYAVFIALSQITAAFLLFFRRTVRLGSVLFLCIMVNIVAVDIAFGVDFDAFIMAVILLCMGLFIFLSEFPLIIKYFINEPSLYRKENMPTWVNRIHKFKFVYILIAFFGFFILLYYANETYTSQYENNFYGVWELQQGDMKFNKLYFEGNGFQAIESGKIEEGISGQLNYNENENRMALRYYPQEYLNKIYGQENFKIDTTQRQTLFKGTYELNNNILELHSDNNKITFKKIR